MKGRTFLIKLYLNGAFLSVFVRQLLICASKCEIVFFKSGIMIVHVLSSKVFLGEGDKNGWQLYFV